MSSPLDFGRRHGGPFSAANIPWDQVGKGIRQALAALAVVVVLLEGGTMFYRIDASDEGVVLRFGKRREHTVPPGLHMKLPWPIESVYKVPVQRIQSLEFGFETTLAGRKTLYAPQTSADLAVAEMLTGDLNLGTRRMDCAVPCQGPGQFSVQGRQHREDQPKEPAQRNKVRREPGGAGHDQRYFRVRDAKTRR